MILLTTDCYVHSHVNVVLGLYFASNTTTIVRPLLYHYYCRIRCGLSGTTLVKCKCRDKEQRSRTLQTTAGSLAVAVELDPTI